MGKYHHGDLRAALVCTALDLVAEQGLPGFSVAETARRAGVSAAAPYRHFPDRDTLLAAVAGEVADQLTDRIGAAISTLEDPAARAAAAAGAYTRYAIERRAGLHVIFAAGLQDPKHTDLHEKTRSLMDLLLGVCLALTPDVPAALTLFERLFAQAHGYAAFHLDGVFAQHGHDTDEVVRRSTDAARSLVSP